MFSLMNKTVIKGGEGVKRPIKMLVFGHNIPRRLTWLRTKNVDFVRKNGGRGGGQKVMTVLFIRENVDNYGRPLR